MNTEKFVEMVKTMRDAQKEYFKCHDKRALVRAKMLEGTVDKMIHDYEQESKADGVQLDLFSGQ